jgi:23S rRNA (adenine2030-N6)-methyltransferase
MNYRHAFHAGNFADVHKHVVLLAVLERLQRKPTPLLCLDTHAGRGRYELSSAAAQEWQSGIGRLFASNASHPELRRYLQAVQRSNLQGLQHYPGSPLLLRDCLRADDRLLCIEQEPSEARALREALGNQHRRTQVICGDGYTALARALPPQENRGLVLIDPPYERDQEFTLLQQALSRALTRWRGGVFACWYPLKSGPRVERFHAALMQSGLRKLLLVELAVQPADSPLGLNGSGMLLVNPPWQLDIELPAALEELHALLAPAGSGGVRVEWLVPE